MLLVALSLAPGGTAVGWECLAADVDLKGWGHWDSVPEGV